MTLSALEGVLGALFRAPHPAPRLEGGTLCCESVFVYRVGHLPHGLAYNLFGSCLGFLSGTHLSTSTLTVRVPLSVGENPEQAVSRLPAQCAISGTRGALLVPMRFSRTLSRGPDSRRPGPAVPRLPRSCRRGLPTSITRRPARRALTPGDEPARNPVPGHRPGGGLARRAVSPSATCRRSCTSRVSPTRSCRFATARPTAFSWTSPPGPGSRQCDPWCQSAPSAGASCRPGTASSSSRSDQTGCCPVWKVPYAGRACAARTPPVNQGPVAGRSWTTPTEQHPSVL